MRTKARKLERKTRAAELDMEIMRAREANGLPVISPMLGLSPEKWECEFRDYLVALGDPRVADPEWLAARIREELPVGPPPAFVGISYRRALQAETSAVLETVTSSAAGE